MAMDSSYTNGNGMGHTSRRMLYRSPSDRMLGGVCGGVADYLGWDPALVRVLWVGATLITSGAGFLVYLLLWLLLPVGTQVGGAERAAAIQFNDAMGKRLAVVLMALGGLWLLNNLGILNGLWGAVVVLVRLAFWPALLITIGYLLLNRSGDGVWRSRMAEGRSRMAEWRRDASEWFSRTRAQAPSAADVRSGVQDARRGMPLRRSQDRIFLGVCGGIGEALHIDPALVRLLWVVLSLGSMGAGLLVYLAMGLLLPEAESKSEPVPEAVQDLPIVDERGATSQGGMPQDTVLF